MLRRLKLRNFKSWQKASLDFGQITGLFGINSSGKSSIGQFLLLLKQTRDATDRATTLELNGDFVKLGTAQDVIWAHDSKSALDFELEFKHGNELKIPDISGRSNTLNDSRKRVVYANFHVSKQAFQCLELKHSVGDASFSVKSAKNGGFVLHADVPDFEFSFKRQTGQAWPLSRPVKAYRFPDKVRNYYQNSGFLSDLETAYEDALDSFYYLGPLREPPSRDYLWARSRPTDVGNKGERTIDAIIAAQDAGECQNLGYRMRKKPFSEVIAHWLRELGLVEQFHISEITPGSNRWQVKVKTHKHHAEVMLTDIGFGVSQVLPVITLLHYVPEGSTVFLEQPEIHLHPLTQAGLANVIVHAARHRKLQVILESHSEHLLLRLQRQIAEGNISGENVALYFCASKSGISTMQSLELDLWGNINNWPDKFMGDAFEETAQAELARIRRMKDASHSK